jgi:hypothetical protein
MEHRIEKVMVVSSLHVHPWHYKVLREGVPLVFGISCDRNPYGVTVGVPDGRDPDDKRLWLEAPEVAAGLAFASGAGCDWLRYDQDGGYCNELGSLGIDFSVAWARSELRRLDKG